MIEHGAVATNRPAVQISRMPIDQQFLDAATLTADALLAHDDLCPGAFDSFRSVFLQILQYWKNVGARQLSALVQQSADIGRATADCCPAIGEYRGRPNSGLA